MSAHVSQPFQRSAHADTFFRFSEVDSASADDDLMEVQVAFSSEQPVLRTAGKAEEDMGIAKKGEKYYEVLSHKPEHADFTLLNKTGAFLDEHKSSEQLGSVRRAKLSKDDIGRAILRYDGASDLSKTRYKQMRGGSRPHISFGYVHTAFIGDDGEKNGIPLKRIAFAADEISSVARPADITVGVRRSATGQWACLGCGDMFDSAALDDNYECECCRKDDSKRSANPNPTPTMPETKERAAIRELSHLFYRAETPEKISLENLRQLVGEAARKTETFCKDPNGKFSSYCWVQDIVIEEKGVEGGQDVDALFAIIYGADNCTYQVAFTYADGAVTLGEAVEVKPKIEYTPVRSGEEEKTRTAPNPPPPAKAVDSPANANAEKGAETNLTRTNKPMAEPTTNVLDEKKIRSEAEASTRTTVENEFKQRSAKHAERVAAGKKEINDLTEDFVKNYGRNWNGKPGEVFVCGERLRSLQLKAVEQLESQDIAEVRLDFKRAASEVVSGSRAPLNPEDAAVLDNELAERCSIGNIYRAAAKAQARGERHAVFMPKDGAELESHQELRKRAAEFPGGESTLAEGCLLPVNMRTQVRAGTKLPKRFARDAAAGDFASAGALIAPDYRFPTIELLRNLPALSRAGMTLLTGLMGGGIVLPRQTAATTAQSVAENAALTAYDQTFDQIKLNPHRVGTKQNYSRLALLQSSDDFEGIIMADHMAQLALWIDAMGINGSGGNSQPLGILNQQGIGSVMFGGVASTAYNKVIAIETAIRSANIYEDISYLTTSTARGTLRVTPATLTGSTVVSGQSQAIWTTEGGAEYCAGRPAVDSQQIPGNRLIGLVGRHLVMAQWGGIAVVLDTISLADKDQIGLRMNTYIDFALRHAQAVCASADSASVLA